MSVAVTFRVGLWRESAACRDTDWAVFFGEDPRALSDAKAICAGCPVRPECLHEHLHEEYGVFGGLSAPERRRLLEGRHAVGAHTVSAHGKVGYRRGCRCGQCRGAAVAYRRTRLARKEVV